MQIIITGGGGFLGQLLAKKILTSTIFNFSELLLIDIIEPQKPNNDTRLKCLKADISDNNIAQKIVKENTKIIFHLAAVVSGHAEKDFDLGWQVNMKSTLNLLEACRHQNHKIRFVFASTCAVFGGNLPAVVEDMTALNPMGSYGTQKAIGELMINDYSRKGYLEGISLRLPTVCIRPGKANQAASSFVSGIIREPLNGQLAICPVQKTLAVWISSPFTIIENFIHAADIAESHLPKWRAVNLPGIKITVENMLKSLENVAGPKALELVKFEYDEAINQLVLTWPTEIDNTTALNLGFKVDENFDHFITEYIENERVKIN